MAIGGDEITGEGGGSARGHGACLAEEATSVLWVTHTGEQRATALSA